MTKAEAWDKLVEQVNEIDIKRMLEHNGDPMHDRRNVYVYREALTAIDVMVTVYEKLIKQSVEEQSDEGA